MLTAEIDNAAATLHSQLLALYNALKFNVTLAADSAIASDEFLRLLNRHRLRESSLVAASIFTAFGKSQSEEFTAAYNELHKTLQLAVSASDAKHRCKIIPGERIVVASIRQLANQYCSFSFHASLQLQG